MDLMQYHRHLIDISRVYFIWNAGKIAGGNMQTWIYLSYFSVAFLFFVMNFLEGIYRGLAWSPSRILGLLACLVWPVVLIVTVVALVKNRRAAAAQRFHANVNMDASRGQRTEATNNHRTKS
jgi:hypothetical protein